MCHREYHVRYFISVHGGSKEKQMRFLSFHLDFSRGPQLSHRQELLVFRILRLQPGGYLSQCWVHKWSAEMRRPSQFRAGPPLTPCPRPHRCSGRSHSFNAPVPRPVWAVGAVTVSVEMKFPAGTFPLTRAFSPSNSVGSLSCSSLMGWYESPHVVKVLLMWLAENATGTVRGQAYSAELGMLFTSKMCRFLLSKSHR